MMVFSWCFLLICFVFSPIVNPNPKDVVKACYKDKCKGDIETTIPNGKQWVNVGRADESNCCDDQKGACNLCVPPRIELAVCHEDECKGTLTNPIPRGQKWRKVGQASQKGCCRLGMDVCDWCAPPILQVCEGSAEETSQNHERCGSIKSPSGCKICKYGYRFDQDESTQRRGAYFCCTPDDKLSDQADVGKKHKKCNCYSDQNTHKDTSMTAHAEVAANAKAFQAGLNVRVLFFGIFTTLVGFLWFLQARKHAQTNGVYREFKNVSEQDI